MSIHVTKVRVFVASPGDVQPERAQLARVVEELNHTIAAIAPEKALVLELVRWETHVFPTIASNPQEVINEQIGTYDIFIGILWKRMGTPTAVAQSGTEEEFRRAFQRWQEDKTLPVLFYFCQQPFAPPRTQEEVDQLAKVVTFRNELSHKGLVAEYAGAESFADVVRPHLLLVLGRRFSTPAKTLELASSQAPEARTSGVSLQVLALAQEYERLRATLPSGSDRTRKMEIVASKMRSLALSASPLLPDLARNASPGQRLAAVTILESLPQPAYLTWLAERLGTEKPFIGYHAAIALLTAVRSLDKSLMDAVKEAVVLARKNLLEQYGGDPSATDRMTVLQEAEKEWAARMKETGDKEG